MWISLLCFPLAAADLPAPTAILADAKKAYTYFEDHCTSKSCDWTRSTYQLGLMEYYYASLDKTALDLSYRWADSYDYKLCARKSAIEYGHPTTGVHMADHQLCGAIYTELFKIDGNASHITDLVHIFGEEIANASSTKNWDWVDALHMGMNPYSRLGNATGEIKYFEQMFSMFSESALPGGAYTFWNTTDHLFYRDDRFLHSQVYWGRGNGWSIAALTAALRFGEGEHYSDPHRSTYLHIFKQLAAKLKDIQGPDGAWRASLLNVTGYPSPEMTGTSNFVYGIAYGINAGILDAGYLPVVESGWKFMSGTALQDSGLYGYCQPVGGSPEHNINENSTNDFCVGQFLMAASQVSQLSQKQQ